MGKRMTKITVEITPLELGFITIALDAMNPYTIRCQTKKQKAEFEKAKKRWDKMYREYHAQKG
jgi:hypothetical protein